MSERDVLQAQFDRRREQLLKAVEQLNAEEFGNSASEKTQAYDAPKLGQVRSLAGESGAGMAMGGAQQQCTFRTMVADEARRLRRRASDLEELSRALPQGLGFTVDQTLYSLLVASMSSGRGY